MQASVMTKLSTTKDLIFPVYYILNQLISSCSTLPVDYISNCNALCRIWLSSVAFNMKLAFFMHTKCIWNCRFHLSASDEESNLTPKNQSQTRRAPSTYMMSLLMNNFFLIFRSMLLFIGLNHLDIIITYGILWNLNTNSYIKEFS